MHQLKKYAKVISSSINDPIERKETEDEIYSHLLESYEEFRKTCSNDDEALHLTIEHFGGDDEIERELKQAHIKQMNHKSLLVILGSTILILIVLYTLLLIAFS